MPPFINTICPYCQHANRYDLAELRQSDTFIEKSLSRRIEPAEEEFSENCAACGKKFKFKSPKARRHA